MSLRSLFQPETIAVYGASATDSAKLGNTLLRNAAAGGGRVLAVHPSAPAIDGVDAVPTLDRAVDLALISVPSVRAEAAVADAAGAGAGAAIVLSSGFGEAGPEGKAAQDRLSQVARDAGMRLVGPNCMGVVSHLGDGRWLNGSYFWAVPSVPGGLSFVSQSGAFGGMFFAHLRSSGRGLSRFLSVGNAADVGSTDALEWLGDDPQTTAIGMFIEGIGDGRRFVDVARRITPHKPVVVLKAGKERAGARAAASHTGSMAGSHTAVRAAFRRAGILEATDTDEFFGLIDSVDSNLAPVKRVAVVTISGGPSVLAADAAERAGFELPSLADSTLDRLRSLVPDFAAVGNPIDLTPQCPPANFVEAIEAVYRDPAIEGVIAINCGLDFVEFGQGVARGVAATGKPTTGFVLDAPRVAAAMTGAGVLLSASPERAVVALQMGARR
ncbi:MAG: CoA-binding protein [Acidimicrobiia bacterium]|nr:CoA-binding protein [Acidimicrobiia bacterium]